MKYIATRNSSNAISGTQAIVKGLSQEGGLFVPQTFPQVTKEEIIELCELSYNERASKIISKFLPELSGELGEYCQKAYSLFDGDPAPLVKTDENKYMLELWHGPTHAFKDIALTLLPHLMVGSKKDIGVDTKTLILVATSGDTGKAALEGFKNVDGTACLVLYPNDGVSNLQKLQMQTTTGDNVKVVAINGNFDDAQTAVKQIFQNDDVKKELSESGIELSSANSINWGRLVPQIVYYFSSYCDLLSSQEIDFGDKINFCVPTGNFGNILAGYYAYRMGLPVNKFICASNRNNVLTDFITNGTYTSSREFFKTSSPSMDILISSNLERLIFELSSRDDKLTAERMEQLKNSGTYSISEGELASLKELFYGGYVEEEKVSDTIDYEFEEYGYITDPHTSVALSVYDDYINETDDMTKTVIISTASPYKFVDDVLKSIGSEPQKTEHKSLLKLQEETALPVPSSLLELPKMEKLHTDVIEKTQAKEYILNYIKK